MNRLDAPLEFFRIASVPYFINRRKKAEELGKAPVVENLYGYGIVATIPGESGQVLIGRRGDEKDLRALKRLRPDLVDKADTRARFAEGVARMLDKAGGASLHIENVISDSPNMSCILVAHFCEGGSLADRVHEGAITEPEIAFIALSTAAALSSCKKRGLLHSNLKPSNILFEFNGTENAWQTVLSDPDFLGNEEGRQPDTPVRDENISRADSHGWDEARTIWHFGAALVYLVTSRAILKSESAAGIEHLISEGWEMKTALDESSCPTWLIPIIGKCMAFSVTSPEPIDEIIKALLEHVCVVSAADDLKDFAGPAPAGARIRIADRYLSFLLAECGFIPTRVFGTFDLGWLTKARAASKLYSVHGIAAARKAVKKLDAVLGSWDDDTSVLGQFRNDPERAEFDLGVQTSDPNRHHFEISLTPGAVRHLLDLRCMSKVTVVEDGGLLADLKDFHETARQWLATNSFGLPFSEWSKIPNVGAFGHPEGPPQEYCLYRIAQAFRHAGEFETAKEVALYAFKTMPNYLGKRTLFSTLESNEEYDAAMTIARSEIETAKETGDRNTVAQWSVLLANILLVKNDLNAALPFLEEATSWLNGPHCDIMLILARSRSGMNCTDADIESSQQKLTQTSDLRLHVDFTEIAWRAGKHDLARRWANGLMMDPRIYLPVRKESRTRCERILAEIG